MSNLEEIRALLLSVGAQLDQAQSADTATRAQADGADRLPELVERLSDHVVHPELLRCVLVDLDARVRDLEQAAEDRKQPDPADTGAAGSGTSDGGE